MRTGIRYLTLATAVAAVLTFTINGATAQNIQQEREAKVAADVKKMATDDYWIYNDLDRARQNAAETNKPLMIVFR